MQARMMAEIVKREPRPRPQKGRPVWFGRRNPAQSRITGKMSLRQLYDFIRMLDGTGYPAAFTEEGGLRLEFRDAKLKGKVLEAIQHGVPLVTTSIGAEGIAGAADIMFIADSAEAFAEAIAKVLAEEGDFRDKLARYGPWLRQNFGREKAAAIVLEDFGPVVSRFACVPGDGVPE